MNGHIAQSALRQEARRNPPRRGWPGQRRRRERERTVRRRAVAFDRWAGRLGLGHREAAEYLRLAPGTLGDWERRWRQDHLCARPLGRPCRRSPVIVRNAAIELMATAGPQVGLPALQSAFPQMAVRELQNLQSHYRRLWRLEHSRLVHVLHWHGPGSVWAIDHADPPRPMEGRWPHLLAVRDLASGYQVLWLPVEDETALSTMDALQWLFLEHGPPLVLKSDNGSAFIADDMRTFLGRWQVVPLFSPPVTPQYNGACEAGIGAMKTRTHQQAARAGRPGHWTAEDAEAARRMANELTYPDGWRGLTTAGRWRARHPSSEEDRSLFRQAVERQRTKARCELECSPDQDLHRQVRAQIDRVAIRRALVELGYLTFTRRSITPPLPSQKTPRIS